jgi:hypothetical protein
VKPGVHSVPAAREYPDCGAGGTRVTEVPFLVFMTLTATIRPSGAEPSNARAPSISGMPTAIHRTSLTDLDLNFNSF